MDLDRNLKRAALRIAEAVHKFARSKEWPREDYRVFIRVHPDWNHFSVELISHEIQDRKDLGPYHELLDFLDVELKDDPELVRSIGLSISPFDGYTFIPNFNWGDSSVEVDDVLLNPGVQDLRCAPPFHPS